MFLMESKKVKGRVHNRAIKVQEVINQESIKGQILLSNAP
jgi:hypothetical protein